MEHRQPIFLSSQRSCRSRNYADAAKKRGPAFTLSMIAVAGLVLQALWGITWTFVLA